MNAGKTRINLPKHNAFTKRHGERVIHSMALRCPYGNTDDPNRHDIRCTHCGGKGYLWVNEKHIYATISDVHTQKVLMQLGLALPGDAIMGPRTYERPITTMDQITFTWPMAHEGDLITRRTDGKPDLLYYKSGMIQGKTALSCLAVIDDDIVNYTEGTDFTISGRELTWGKNRGPEPGTQYTIKYMALFDWIAFVPPTPRYERGANLGQRVVLRKKHLITWEVD